MPFFVRTERIIKATLSSPCPDKIHFSSQGNWSPQLPWSIPVGINHSAAQAVMLITGPIATLQVAKMTPAALVPTLQFLAPSDRQVPGDTCHEGWEVSHIIMSPGRLGLINIQIQARAEDPKISARNWAPYKARSLDHRRALNDGYLHFYVLVIGLLPRS